MSMERSHAGFVPQLNAFAVDDLADATQLEFAELFFPGI